MITDKEKMQAHKRMVMNTMKTIMFAPMVLTKTLIKGGFQVRRGSSDKSLLEAEEEPSPESPGFEIGAATYHVDDNSLGSLLSLELSLNLMHMNKESLGRALVITSAIDESQMYIISFNCSCTTVQKIFCPLLKAIGEKHIKSAFDK